MAIKMMTMGDLDKQFLDNNLLTDEDLQFDVPGTLEAAFEHNSLIGYINNDLELSKTLVPDNSIDMIDETIMDFLNADIKTEPLSPSSCKGSPDNNVYFSESDEVPVLSIPDTGCPDGVIIPDTPPHTPPNASEQYNSSYLSGSQFSMPICTATPTVVNNVSSFVYSTPANGLSMPQMKTDINIKPKLILNDTINQKPLVLTPEQFALLTNGKLKVKSVCEVNSNVGSSASVIFPNNNCIFTPAKSNSVVQSNGRKDLRHKNLNIQSPDMTAIKRQQRMIKNRESACLSRRKKKEYMQKLEGEIKEIVAENSKLQIENKHLKQQVFHLEKENASLKVLNDCLKSKVSPSALKKTVGLMVVLFMVSFNIAPFSRLFDGSSSNTIASISPHRRGRTLLWDDGVGLKDIQNNSYSLREDGFINGNYSMTFMDDLNGALNVTMCPTYINKTESERLDNDLRVWVQRVEKKQKLKDTLNTKKSLLPLPKLKSWMRRKKDHVWNKHQSSNEILIYQTPRAAYEEFFDAIHRRDDTFYFVSFSGDHLLLPASTHNQTSRPRMSLVMPAMTFNDSMGNMEDHVGMMQIDCEVMNTKLVYVKQSAIPEHFREKSNSTKVPLHKKTMRYSVNDKEPKEMTVH